MFLEQKQNECIIHCTGDDGELIYPKNLESWKTLLKAAQIRKHEPILNLSEQTSDEEIPDICYHRKCRSIFTMKRELDKICKNSIEEPCTISADRRSSQRGPPARGTTYEKRCIFCNKESKYAKGNMRENLIQCSDLRSDETIRRIATEKNDTKILAIVTRELIAAEACYHRSCYRNYTRPMKSTSTINDCSESEGIEYNRIESEALGKLYDYIRQDILENPRLVRFTELTKIMVLFMQEAGATEMRESTKTHLRRKLEAEFGSLLQYEDLLGNSRLFVIPENLSRVQLARDVVKLSQQLHTSSDTSREEIVQQAALDLRKAILANTSEMSWPPKPSELTGDAVTIPENVKAFLSTLLTGNIKCEEPFPERIERLVKSFAQDLIFGVTGGRQKTPKHVLLPYAVKSLTNNVQLIRIINRCGHGMSYTQLEELNTALCLQKLSATPENTVPLPESIKPYISTSLAWDNIDRLEETLSGGGTSHRVNGIAVQARHFGPHLPPLEMTIAKSKKRSLDIMTDSELPIYNAGERNGPPKRTYVEVTSSELEEIARKKTFLWVLVRLHAADHQHIGGWTGFNITVRNEVEVVKDNIGYLPTINAPATSMSTVFEVLSQSLKIKDSLKLSSIVAVFDQALYAKATEIKWKHSDHFKDLVLRMGVFHTTCTLLGVIGKRFQDAGLQDLCVESQVIADGSISGVLEGRRYNRAIRLHKLIYEALMRQAWSDFQNWIENEKEKEEKSLVDDTFANLQNFCNSVCEAEFQKKLSETSFCKVTELFQKYLSFLRNKNGKLSEFWVSYLDLVDILLAMIRASREGNWELHLSSIRSFIPWCFAYDNLNYARYLSSYVSEMSHLEEEHPDVHTYLKSGGFAVQMGDDNPFGKIPVDQACEETVNKDTQTSGGTKGFSLKPKAVNKYYLIAEYRSIFMRNLKEMLHLDQSSSQVGKSLIY